MQFVKHDGFFGVSSITGPGHHYLELAFGTGAAERPAFEFLPPSGSCTHPPLDASAIVAAVVEGVNAVNEEAGTSYTVSRIRVPADDTKPEQRYALLAAAIVRRLHRGEPFNEATFRA
jgi:hypothetical protein